MKNIISEVIANFAIHDLNPQISIPGPDNATAYFIAGKKRRLTIN